MDENYSTPQEDQDTEPMPSFKAKAKAKFSEAKAKYQEIKEKRYQSQLSGMKAEGVTEEEKWAAQEKTRKITEQKRLEKENLAEHTANMAKLKALKSESKKKSRESSIIGSSVATMMKRSDKKAERRAKYSQPRQKKVVKEAPVEVSGPNSNLFGMGNLRQLTAPRVPGTSSPNRLSPIGDLSHLRGMTIGNPSNKKLSPNLTNVLLAMQGGITTNKEISDITSMPIMQVARSKSSLKRKGLIRA
jgi:hypothetical protein